MSIFEVEHQPMAQRLAQQALAAGRLAHGLLLAGPEGVGKEMFAQRLAALLLCDNPIRNPKSEIRNSPTPDPRPPIPVFLDSCGRCRSCQAAAAGTHPDIHLVYRELHRLIKELEDRKGLELYIEVVRRFVIEPAMLTSVFGRGKVFIVRQAHLMNDEAQNALLKTLEEPPADTFVMLLTDQAHRLAETIRSRCQLFRFNPLPLEFVRSRLAGATVGGRKIDSAEADYLAARAGGRLGEAIRMAERDLFALDRELADKLAELKSTDAMDLADWMEQQTSQLAKERMARDAGLSDSQAKKEAASELLATAALVLADALRIAAGASSGGEATRGAGVGEPAGPPAELQPPLFADVAAKLAGGADPEQRLERLSRAIAALMRADYLIGVRFVNPRLALDEAALALAGTIPPTTA